MEAFTASLIGTFIGASLTGGTAFLLARYNNGKSEEKRLNDQLRDILKISIQFPYLESHEFAKSWDSIKLKSKDKDEFDKYQRYDIYTNLVFNFMEELSIHCNFDSDKILKQVDIKTWVRIHKNIWKNPVSENENSDGYRREFKELINHYIN